MYKKLKSWLLDDVVYTFGLLLLVGVASFGLGRLSVRPQATVVTGNIIGLEQASGTTPYVVTSATTTVVNSVDTPQPPVTAEPLVASKSGTKYHRLTCPGAKQIKTENKIFFASAIEATASGYTPAANCPGL